MELLYKSLEDLLADYKNKFTLKTICMLADQMVYFYSLLYFIF